MDDEYFRLMIAGRLDKGDHPDVEALTDIVSRSLDRPQARGLRARMDQSLVPVNVFSPGGLFVGRATGYRATVARLTKVITRVTTGLYYHEFCERLPRTYKAFALTDTTIASLPEDTRDRWHQWADTIAESAPPTVVGNGVFSYWRERSEDDPCSTFWRMSFFGVAEFCSVTVPLGVFARAFP